jgi:ABC-type uncharacterized transport system permease subunit
MLILLNGLAAAVYAATGVASVRASHARTAVAWLASAAWVVHGAALAAVVVGENTVFGWSLGLSMMGWVLVAIYALESGFFRTLRVPVTVWWLAAGACLLVIAAPPARPVPAGANVWFTGHWVLGLAAYALFAAAVLHGLWLRASDRALQARTPNAVAKTAAGLPLLVIEKLMMRLVWAGFVVLTLSLLLGVVFGEQLAGRALKADYKTVFSVLAWAVFAGLLIAHHTIGVRGKQAVKWLWVGSVFLLLGYVGSRFVLDVILGRT